MRSLGVFAISNIFVCFWTLTTTLFFTLTTVAFHAYPTGDVKARLCEEEEENFAESEIQTADILIPRIIFAAHPSTDSPSFTSSFVPRHSFTSRATLRNRMLSPSDTVASNLWRTYLEHSAFVLPRPNNNTSSVTPSSSPHYSLRRSDNGDTSELPYLTKDRTESASDFPLLSSPVISLTGSGLDSNLLATMLYYDGDSDDETDASTSVESAEFQAMVVCPTPGIPRSSSRPVLQLQIVSGATDVEPSSPSPVDSGYGSRPDTPFLEKDTEPKALDDVSTCGDFLLSAQNVPTENDALSADLKLLHHAAPAKHVANQGPTLPQIVLFDEQGRVIDRALGDQRTNSGWPISQVEDESPYGGLAYEFEQDETTVTPAAVASSNSAILDRAFLSVTQPCALVTPYPTAPVYRYCRPAPAFVLESVEEEDEGEEEAAVEAEVLKTDALLKGSKEMLAETNDEAQVSSYSKPIHRPVPSSNNVSVIATPIAASSPATAGGSNPILVLNEEDDELETCGLFFTVPDANYLRLASEHCQSAGAPDIAFGLLKLLTSQTPVKTLETAYHAFAEGRTLTPLVAECRFGCENGYWVAKGELASVRAPRDCPAHGGRGTCDVGAIFHHVANMSICDSPSLDYATHAIEVVGMYIPPSSDSQDDFDEDELVLHRADSMHAPQRRGTVPQAGANYDEFMSAFMDDVDLGPSNSTDSFKHAPLGKFGDALKELRDAAMPEAVDHFKESLGKTESVLRAALAASPFKLNVMSDKLHFKSGHKSSVSKEKNEFYSVMKERSAVSMKGKWSSMLNKFAR